MDPRSIRLIAVTIFGVVILGFLFRWVGRALIEGVFRYEGHVIRRESEPARFWLHIIAVLLAGGALMFVLTMSALDPSMAPRRGGR